MSEDGSSVSDLKFKRVRIINTEDHQEIVNRYQKYLAELIDRLWIAKKTSQHICSLDVQNEYQSIDLDLLFLQLRKAFEIISYMTLVAHQTIVNPLPVKMKKEYNASKILKFLKTKNQRCFPISGHLEAGDGDERTFIPTLNYDGLIPLSEQLFQESYNEVIAYHLHANHEYRRTIPPEIWSQMGRIDDLIYQTVILARRHLIFIKDEYVLVAATQTNGPPRVQLARRAN